MNKLILNKIFLSGKIKIIRFGVMWEGGGVIFELKNYKVILCHLLILI